MAEYRMRANGMHQRFMMSRAKIQVIGGGYGNGKTAAMCVKAITIAENYPGANLLMARSTFPKLNDTLRKEFKKWLPKRLIQSFPESKNSDNTAKLTNGTYVNFRYIAQQGKSAESTTSNLLSATYDAAFIDQMEDPEIVEKDFYDILGRMRGNAIYRGSDPSMPRTGPRWIILSCNPTANWFYRRVIRPYQTFMKTGEITEDLLCERHENGEPVLINGQPIMMMELFEASTYENKDNLGPDFIKTLESTYKGQMKDRFLLGKWASYEGLVYPQFDEMHHVVTDDAMRHRLEQCETRLRRIRWVEGYDYGSQSPSCYLLAFMDEFGCMHVIDGFYEAELPIDVQYKRIRAIRARYGVSDELIYADPSIFKRHATGMNGVVGQTTSDLLYADGKGVRTQRGNNDIDNGIIKVGSYLNIGEMVRNPYTFDTPSARIFINSKLQFIIDEITAYMWAKKADGTPTDKPVDRNDHAMDTLKYMTSDLPQASELQAAILQVPAYMQWQEREVTNDTRAQRYG